MSSFKEFLAVYAENWADWGPQIYAAIWVTIELTIVAFAIAVVLGLLLALGKLSPLRAIRAFSTGYIEVARGVPALAILFLLYFGLVPLGIVFDAFAAGAIGLGMSAAGYIAEVFRAGIEAIHKGQREAALAVGMTPVKTFRYIILPQAMRVILPPLLNMVIILLKDTSICSLISTEELMLRAKDLAMMSFLPMHLFLLAGVIYFLLAWPLSLITRRVETIMQRGRRQTFKVN
ncbi:MAG: amino acid ABC transporter permease [Gammaproteobacteria bacterium]|nr:amino acid ABC transporter permease [Gammaproteobacteria bacterium]